MAAPGDARSPGFEGTSRRVRGQPLTLVPFYLWHAIRILQHFGWQLPRSCSDVEQTQARGHVKMGTKRAFDFSRPLALVPSHPRRTTLLPQRKLLRPVGNLHVRQLHRLAVSGEGCGQAFADLRLHAELEQAPVGLVHAHAEVQIAPEQPR
jgi:hypothetical protein